MPDSTGRHSLVEKFFRICLLIFGGILLLQASLQRLAEIWPWLVGVAVITAGITGLVWWLRIRQRW